MVERPAEKAAPASAEAEEFDPRSLRGKPLSEAEARLGKPKGKLKSGSGVTWLYDGVEVTSANGKTISAVSGVPIRAPTSSDDRLAAQAAARATSQANKPKFVEVRNNGAAIRVGDLVVPGKVTLVKFSATWCGPCQQFAPILHQYVEKEPDVFLCDVDIGTWDTPVAAQFQIHSIPRVDVYGRNGAFVGTTGGSVSEVQALVNAAR